MNLLQFYLAMSYHPLTFLNEDVKYKYIFYFREIVDLINRPRVSSYTRYYLYEKFKDIDHELIEFIKANNKKLPNDQQKFIRGLLNLTKNLKRYISNTKANAFPAAMTDITTVDLQQFLKEYVKAHNFKMEQDVILLSIDSNLELAQKLLPEAKKMLE